MRPPRYRFPEHVRETTRAMAARMVREGTIPRTPEELDAWIRQAPDAQESLERGGFGTAFTSADLLPLLEVFVVKAGGPAPKVDAPPPAQRRRGPLVLAVVIALAVAALVILALQ